MSDVGKLSSPGQARSVLASSGASSLSVPWPLGLPVPSTGSSLAWVGCGLSVSCGRAGRERTQGKVSLQSFHSGPTGCFCQEHEPGTISPFRNRTLLPAPGLSNLLGQRAQVTSGLSLYLTLSLPCWSGLELRFSPLTPRSPSRFP